MKAARVAVEPTEHPMSEHDHYAPHHSSSPTDHLLSELQLYGYRPFSDEPDPRPLPEGNHVAGAIADIFDALIVTLEATLLDPGLVELPSSPVNLSPRAVRESTPFNYS